MNLVMLVLLTFKVVVLYSEHAEGDVAAPGIPISSVLDIVSLVLLGLLLLCVLLLLVVSVIYY